MSIKNSALLAAFTLTTLVAAPAFAAPTPRPTPAAVSQADAPRASKSAKLDADAARYAKRDSKAKKQKDYQGGSVLVIGISTGAAIIALIIVLLLL